LLQLPAPGELPATRQPNPNDFRHEQASVFALLALVPASREAVSDAPALGSKIAAARGKKIRNGRSA